MIFRLLADATVLLHLGFVIFVIVGGFLVARWPRLSWAHLPAAAWGAWTEFAGWICPLTPLENWLRLRGGGPTYGGSFVDRYLMPVLYPEALSRPVQFWLGVCVVVINVVAYAVVLRRARARQRRSPR